MSNAITKKKFSKLEAHKHAAIFPMMAEKDFANLKEDIKANGLLEPIILFEGQILDGRNRHKACCELLNDKDLTYAVIKSKIKEFDGKDSTEYVISTNLFRRQLNESQRALVGAKILPHFQKKTKENQEDQESSRANLHSGRSDGWAAKCVNVSARSVASAKAILDKDIPLLNDLVESGLMKVSTGGTFCSHNDCKKLINDAHKSVLEHWEAKRQKRLSELRTHLEDAEKELEAKRNELMSDLEKKASDPDVDKATLDEQLKKLKAATDLESAPKELKPFYRKIKDIKKKRAELDIQKEPKNPDELIRSPFGVECIKAAYKQASDIQYELGVQFKATDKDGISFEIISRSTKNARKDYIPLDAKYNSLEEAQNHIDSLMNGKNNLDEIFKPVLAKLDSIKDAVAGLLKN